MPNLHSPPRTRRSQPSCVVISLARPASTQSAGGADPKPSASARNRAAARGAKRGIRPMAGPACRRREIPTLERLARALAAAFEQVVEHAVEVVLITDRALPRGHGRALWLGLQC